MTAASGSASRKPPAVARPRWPPRSGGPASRRSRSPPTRISSGRSSGWRPSAGNAGRGMGRPADVVPLAGRPPLAPPHPARARALRRARAAAPPGGRLVRLPHRHPPADDAERTRPADAAGRPVHPRARPHGDRPCPTARDDRPAARGRDGHPRLRRLGQHGRHRPPADPDGRGQGGRQGLRRAAALERRDRRRRVQRLGPVRPGADERPGDRPRGDRPAHSAARDVARTGDPGVAGRHRDRGGRHAGRLLQQPVARRRRRPRHRSRPAITPRR